MLATPEHLYFIITYFNVLLQLINIIICASLHLSHGLSTYYSNCKFRDYRSEIASSSFTGKVNTRDLSALLPLLSLLPSSM